MLLRRDEIVDGTVIMVEAIFRRLSQTTELSASEEQAISPDTIMGMKAHAILSAAADVSRSIFFAAAIIIAAFLPLFTLSGVEGVIFAPMAHTYAFAIGGAICLALTLTPLRITDATGSGAPGSGVSVGRTKSALARAEATTTLTA